MTFQVLACEKDLVHCGMSKDQPAKLSPAVSPFLVLHRLGACSQAQILVVRYKL